MKKAKVLFGAVLTSSLVGILASGSKAHANALPMTPPPANGYEKFNGVEVIYNTNTEKREADRILLRYAQIWNMFRVRNDLNLPDEEKARIDALMNASRVPVLHSEIPIEDLKQKIRENATELRKYLRAEIKVGLNVVDAQANLNYLENVLLRSFTGKGIYAQLSSKRFNEEFKRVIPAAGEGLSGSQGFSR